MNGSAAGMCIDLEYPALRGELLGTMNKFSCDFSVDLRIITGRFENRRNVSLLTQS